MHYRNHLRRLLKRVVHVDVQLHPFVLRDMDPDHSYQEALEFKRGTRGARGDASGGVDIPRHHPLEEQPPWPSVQQEHNHLDPDQGELLLLRRPSNLA